MILLGALLSVSLGADTVYLKNGNSFENVVAELTDTQVRIHLPFGEISIARDRVTRVEKRRSAFQEFLARWEALQNHSSATAKSWLDLALWARDQGLKRGFREAAVRAAELEPKLEGLQRIMPRMDFVFNESLEAWIPHAESQRRRGLVEYRGDWITPTERADRLTEERAAEVNRLAAKRQERIAQVVELLALAQLRQSAAASGRAQPTMGVTYAVPSAYVVPGFFGVPAGFLAPRVVVRKPAAVITHSDVQAAPPRPRHHRGTWHDLVNRQPGSLLPVGGRTRSSSSNR